MYEDITYELILKRLLDRVPTDLDKREGSMLFYALAPAAAQLQIMYIQLDTVLKELFADTASRKYLLKRAAERGLSPKAATYAVLKGKFNLDIPIGSRFSLDTLNYVAAEKMGAGEYQLRCETIGSQGNNLFGDLIPIDFIPKLTSARITELLIPGEDEEETEHFRNRYFSSLNSQAFGGNIADYRDKVNSIAGVGGVKVYPAWNGGGTVKLVIIDSEYKMPSKELIQAVKEAMDPEEAAGKGYGMAPIGHLVTVEGAWMDSISIQSSIIYGVDYSFERCREEILKVVDDYLEELNRSWSNSDSLVVRVSRLESRLLDVAGVMDITDTVINGKTGNYQLASNSLAVRGDVSG